MTQLLNQLRPMVHVRFAGKSYRFEESVLAVSPASSDGDIKQALAHHFDVPASRFATYVVERHDNRNITVRPEAVFG